MYFTLDQHRLLKVEGRCDPVDYFSYSRHMSINCLPWLLLAHSQAGEVGGGGGGGGG